MKNNKKTDMTGAADDSAGTHHDPPLIPAQVYNDEHRIHNTGNTGNAGKRVKADEGGNLRDELSESIDRLQSAVNDLRQDVISHLTPQQHVFIGKGFRNYGFMIAANQSVNNFPDFAPSFIDIDTFNENVHEYLFLRDMSERVMGITDRIREMMNIFGNLGFEAALAYYNNVATLAERTDDINAKNVYGILRRFFRRGSSVTDANGEPTMKSLEKDFNALEHGRKDGEIIIRNETPHVSAGGKVHEVIDSTHKPATEKLGATVSEIICSNCNTRVAAGSKFCSNCGQELRVKS